MMQLSNVSAASSYRCAVLITICHVGAKLKLAATEHMVKLEQSPERIKSFFQDPRVKYAVSKFKLHLAGSI